MQEKQLGGLGVDGGGCIVNPGPVVSKTPPVPAVLIRPPNHPQRSPPPRYIHTWQIRTTHQLTRLETHIHTYTSTRTSTLAHTHTHTNLAHRCTTTGYKIETSLSTVVFLRSLCGSAGRSVWFIPNSWPQFGHNKVFLSLDIHLKNSGNIYNHRHSLRAFYT